MTDLDPPPKPEAEERYRTTEGQFEIFKAECERLQKLWNLDDWDVKAVHEELPGRKAESRTNCISGKATVALSTHWGALSAGNVRWYGATNEDVVESARHEMVHVLLGRLSGLGAARYTTSDEMNAAEEALVLRLMRLLPGTRPQAP